MTLTFSGSEVDPASGSIPSLADGRYTLTILSSNVSAGGVALNGGGPSGNYVSPPDTAGGGGLGLYRLYGDVNGDGVVNAFDFAQFRLGVRLVVHRPVLHGVPSTKTATGRSTPSTSPSSASATAAASFDLAGRRRSGFLALHGVIRNRPVCVEPLARTQAGRGSSELALAIAGQSGVGRGVIQPRKKRRRDFIVPSHYRRRGPVRRWWSVACRRNPNPRFSPLR